ncbi:MULTISPECIES: tRNA glutamyl-Q(34) synthetase GluQRS [unclassified Ruegeria]|uniref:tRNA glutamyl-Q(34) synthetase GluQRS n=1 Tax=unclassified Ruegeria TaxID=2625375 RepID=UPI001ADBE349|nr:tRNA glutamyl-Q(34) synthetase GluQRS [Ruegeria sp. R8_1]MBO9413997.1 tRNA glutamyl-Q(34) synthetase GluQRS [Ruegeria sp. R8_2]
MTFTTRFAPSPTGPLHLGHAYSALLASDMATDQQGVFLLRIEDIDRSRSRTQWEDQIYDDLEWLGLSWPSPVLRQSERLHAYEAALENLWSQGLLYPCTCNRRDIAAAASAPQEGTPLLGPDGLIYPGTCRNVAIRTGAMPRNVPLRLDMEQAGRVVPPEIEMSFLETGFGPNRETGQISFSRADLVNTIGDVVLSRRDMGTSYHLSVVLDDAEQGITRVVRGCDLFEATRIHVLLQILLGLPRPSYHHHSLIRDDTGKRLAKRDDARAISKYRADGASPEDIREMVGLQHR